MTLLYRVTLVTMDLLVVLVLLESRYPTQLTSKKSTHRKIHSDSHLPTPAVLRETVVTPVPLVLWELLVPPELLAPAALLEDPETVETLYVTTAGLPHYK